MLRPGLEYESKHDLLDQAASMLAAAATTSVSTAAAAAAWEARAVRTAAAAAVGWRPEVKEEDGEGVDHYGPSGGHRFVP